uniref:Uncharacterized protein n=1 Tax=Steinernema glaseri TaxID=37863 RepID=A0A1I7YM65_9BILA
MDTAASENSISLTKTPLLAQPILDRTRKCEVVVPGLFCESLTDLKEDEAFAEAPVFKDLNGYYHRPTKAKYLMSLTVIAENLVFHKKGAKAKGVSLRKVQKLMASCRDVAVRELIVKKFPSDSIPQRPLFSELTTYFNRVVLHYDSDTASFREFLLAFVAGKKLQMLAVSNVAERTIFALPFWFPRLSFYPTLTPWLQEALLEVF